ncbi:MAG: ABC transporter permease [candidate division KSB1 bacterium]|nr:ABC transporter permease [candidate division KSB1 bacterium]
MGLLLKLAWRNVMRNRRRSAITTGAVAFALMLTIAMRGMQRGTYELNIRNVARLYTGYLQVQAPGYQENPTLRNSFPYTREVRRVLDAEPLVTGHAPRVYADGLLSYRDNSFGVMILGLDPQAENEVTDLLKRIRQGRAPAEGQEYEILVGQKLLQNLQAQLGDSLVLLVQGYDGSLRDAFCRIVGVLRTGSEPMDRATVIMPIRQAQELLGLEDRVSTVVVSLDRLEDLEPARRRLEPALRPPKLRVLSWEEVMPSFKQMIQFDNAQGILFLAILIVAVGFGILNSVIMSVTERFREFGIVLALGMPQHKLVAVVALEILFVLLFGVAAGNVLGGVVNWYLVHNPIEFTGTLGAYTEEFGWLPILTSSLRARVFLHSTLAIVLATFGASLYPLLKVAKLEPLKGIRYT